MGLPFIFTTAASLIAHYPFLGLILRASELHTFKKLGTMPGHKTESLDYSGIMENRKTLIAGLILNLGLLALFIAYLVAALVAGTPA